MCHHRVHIPESHRTCDWVVKPFAELVSHPRWWVKFLQATVDSLAIWCGDWGELFMCCCKPLWYLEGRGFPADSASSWISSRWIMVWPSSMFCNFGLVLLPFHKQNLHLLYWKSCLETCEGPVCVLACISSSVEERGSKALLSFGEMLPFSTSQHKWKAEPYTPFYPWDTGFFCQVHGAGRNVYLSVVSSLSCKWKSGRMGMFLACCGARHKNTPVPSEDSIRCPNKPLLISYCLLVCWLRFRKN